MATAVQPTLPAAPAAASATSEKIPLLIGSLLGALGFLAGVVIAAALALGFPKALGTFDVPYIEAVRIFIFSVVLVLAVFASGFLAKFSPAPGLRGGILLATAGIIATIFIVRAFAIGFAGSSLSWIFVLVSLGLCLFGLYRLFFSETGTGFARTLEDQNWFHLNSFKPSQGKLVRRCTMLSVIVLIGSGAWALEHSKTLRDDDRTAHIVPSTELANKWAAESSTKKSKGDQSAEAAKTEAERNGHLKLEVPGSTIALPLMPARQLLLPILLGLVGIYGAWRLVNVPTFADFLIATEAEMNKVSWTPRKRLIQDTVVVLVTVVVLTLFLLVIDLFWGWLLSQSWIGVLPSRPDAGGQLSPDGAPKNW